MNSQLSVYRPCWPETVLFWGAGATRAIGLRTTAELGQAVCRLATGTESLAERVQTELPFLPVGQAVVELLTMLEEDWTATVLPTPLQAELRRSYDWSTLRQLVQICPGHQTGALRLQDLFTLLDMHIASRHGFYVPGPTLTGRRFIAPDRLQPARNALVMLIGLLHFHDFHYALQHNRHVLAQYSGFAKVLAGLMIKEDAEYLAGRCFTGRQYYLFSYAVISMNWDPLLLWLLFQAYNECNDQGELTGSKLRLFHDFGHFIGLRQVDGHSPAVWYPVNEAVVQRLNDPRCGGQCRIRIGKYYFPHGCSGWRECPNCGKLTLYLGNEWRSMSSSLYPPPLPANLSAAWRKPRSAQEQEAFATGRCDFLQCGYCGAMTETKHAPLVIQTGLKGNNPPFVEEIHHEMRIALENAGHIVLLGYTLPPDDVIYRSVLAARQKRGWGAKPFCSVVVGLDAHAPDNWLAGEQLDNYIRAHSESAFANTVRTAREIFSTAQVRGYARGIPAVFLDSRGEADYDRVKELLYPVDRIL